MNSIGTLIGVRFIGAQKPLVHALGLNAAVYLNECLYWQAQVGGDGWFSRTIPQMQSETGLSKAEQKTVRERLVRDGLIEERKGVQYRTQTRINADAFNALLDRIQPTETVQLADGNSLADMSETAAADGNCPDSRPETVGSYNNQEHTKTTSSLTTEFLSDDGLPVLHDTVMVHSDRSGKIDQVVKPWDMWQAFCEGCGQSTELPQGPLSVQLRHAKTAINTGITPPEIRAIASWLHSDEWWRNRGFDLAMAIKQYARWVSAGRPVTRKAEGTKQVRGVTPTI